MTWTNLAADAPSNWWHDAPTPNLDVQPATVLAPLADRLLHRAAAILTTPRTVLTPLTLSLAASARRPPS